mmetsp:Transcript_19163/g.29039  ORF Transcript_19163/g.29039 Transcript_19163/m.29039 type:complete len:80 (+) Transcript_19163:68-307(+)
MMMRTTVDELLEAERLHRRALAAEAKASAVQAAAERGVVLNKMNEEKKSWRTSIYTSKSTRSKGRGQRRGESAKKPRNW